MKTKQSILSYFVLSLLVLLFMPATIYSQAIIEIEVRDGSNADITGQPICEGSTITLSYDSSSLSGYGGLIAEQPNPPSPPSKTIAPH